MDLSTLTPAKGSVKNQKKRIGRGQGSGKGGTSTKGHKGAQSRSGYSAKKGFEGGQMPLIRRLPKRGFNNARFRVSYQAVNLGQLNIFPDGAIVDQNSLIEAGIIRRSDGSVKLLAKGELARRLIIKVQAFSQKAMIAVEKLAGQVEIVTPK